MGTIRLLLAIAVVFAHAGVFAFVGGQNAVQCFYVVSGFLISYVLVERKGYSTTRDFYINRFLRLYPIYFVVAALSLAAASIGLNATVAPVYREAPTTAIALLVATNALLFGQDWIMFSAVEAGKLVFSTNFQISDVPLWRGLLVPQAWTLGVELSFYAIAPYALMRKRRIAVLLACSIGLRLYVLSIGLGLQDPWTYRFFPTELSLFLIGALAHQILRPLYARLGLEKPSIALLCTLAFIGIAWSYAFLPNAGPWNTAILLMAFVTVVPIAFVFQQQHAFDSWLGNLSYPVYINHWLVIELLKNATTPSDARNSLVFACLVAFVSVGLAIALNSVVGSPIERLRNRIRARA